MAASAADLVALMQRCWAHEPDARGHRSPRSKAELLVRPRDPGKCDSNASTAAFTVINKLEIEDGRRG